MASFIKPLKLSDYIAYPPPRQVDPPTSTLDALSLQERPSSFSSTYTQASHMPAFKIRFTQNTIASTFSDGTLVGELTQKLASGEILPDAIPPIRVVYYQSQYWTLDNRRLRAFKDSQTDKIPVVIVDLKDQSIKEEFWNKKTSKSLNEGGAIRKDSSWSLAGQQLEGAYVFNKRVLNWTLEWIGQPMSEHLKTPLSDKYSDRRTYYNSFDPLIFEEARAILQAGLQEVQVQQEFPLQLTLRNLKVAKTAENPTEIKFSLSNTQDNDIKSCDAILLVHATQPQLQILALANYSPIDPLRPELSFKVVIEEVKRRDYDQALREGQLWKGKKLGSLITLQRMFDATTSALGKNAFSLEKCILTGQPFVQKSSEEIPSLAEQLLASLNPSQREALESFLQLDTGLHLIQGPPGTGKTTTIVQLLGVLQMKQERVLVSAPSNKAVHILAERFMQKFPDVPILLVGVEEKLPPDSDLASIFMDLWSIEKIKRLDEWSKLLWSCQPSKLFEGDLKSISIRIARKCEELEFVQAQFKVLINDIKKYKLNAFIDIDASYEKLEQAAISYKHFTNSKDVDWKKMKFYFDQGSAKEPPPMPPWVASIRSCISTIATVLSSLQLKLNQVTEVELLNHAQLVFATLSVSGQQRFKEITPFDTLIVDEAGQAVEAETLIPMKMDPRKCLLIGDIRQLPATIISQDAEKLKFGRSMMERLIDQCDYPSSMLKVQYRMRPEISSWPSQQYYQNMLENAPSVCQPEYTLKEVKKETPFLAPYAFIHIDGKEERDPIRRSFFNAAEADSTVLILHHLAKKCSINVAARVSVISFYASQVKYIQKALGQNYSTIKINTVDGFQGGESDIVIISCVRANYQKQIGFLKASQRLNVALTRARFSLIVLGHQPTLMGSELEGLITDAEKRNVLFKQDVLERLRPNVHAGKAKQPPKQNPSKAQPRSKSKV